MFSQKKYAFLLAGPTHTNIGDHMISLGSKSWSLDNLTAYVYKEFDDDIYKDWSHYDLVRLAIKKGDLILLRGGGSVGDRYLGYELFVRRVLETLKKNKIVIFPQSLYFSQSSEGDFQKAQTAAAYDTHPDLTLCLRDEESFNQARQLFKKTKLRLCPDMALYLNNSYRPREGSKRQGIFLCLRQDGEKHHKNLSDILPEKLSPLGYEISFGDTAAKGKVSQVRRQAVVEDFLANLSKKEAMVTDRYHGLIAAYLTSTPALVLKSEGHKIPSGLKWFEGSGFIFFAEDINEVPALLEKLLAVKEKNLLDFSPHFESLREVFLNA